MRTKENAVIVDTLSGKVKETKFLLGSTDMHSRLKEDKKNHFQIKY